MTDATAEPMTVCDELVNAIRQHKPNFRLQRETETDPEFVERVLQAVADIPDDIYNTLSQPALDWFADAANIANNGGEPPAPAGFLSGFKPKTPKGKKKLIERKSAKQAGPTMGKLIRQAIIDNKDITVADLETMLAANGFTDIKRTTVHSFQRGSLDTLKVAEEMGRFAWPEPVQSAA